MTPTPHPKPQKTVLKNVGPHDSRLFSSFDDLAQWAVDCGLASDIHDVRTHRRDLWGDLLFRWYTQGQVACVFAQSLARTSEEAGWFSAIIDGALDAALVTAMVDAAASSGAEAVQLLFPGEGAAEDAVTLTGTLGQHPRWAVVENEWLEGEAGDSVQIGLRWKSSDDSYESWVLGIAPFEPMPFTRRFVGAPFIALVLRPGKPMPDRATVPTGVTGLPASHLAHMDDLLGKDDPRRQKWTEGTRKAKRALVSPDPMSRARARVTFALPAWAREELRAVLQNVPK